MSGRIERPNSSRSQYACLVRLFRRRSEEPSKAAALAGARRATGRVRRKAADVERYRSSKQPNPANQMTSNQWLGGGG